MSVFTTALALALVWPVQVEKRAQQCTEKESASRVSVSIRPSDDPSPLGTLHLFLSPSGTIKDYDGHEVKDLAKFLQGDPDDGKEIRIKLVVDAESKTSVEILADAINRIKDSVGEKKKALLIVALGNMRVRKC
jgi:hypothetical protein